MWKARWAYPCSPPFQPANDRSVHHLLADETLLKAMYQSFYGLRERPFDITADRRFLLLTASHQEALAHLEYGVSAGTGITLLLGVPGTGKTTLLRQVLASGERLSMAPVVFLTNPALDRHELFEHLAHGFRLSAAAGRSKSTFLRELQDVTVAGRARGMSAVLVIDEAQSLPESLLDEVSLLSNLESETEKLLRVVLAGHPTLGDRLNEPRFHQLKQRVGLRCLLPPLDLNETAGYIAYRIGVAGGNPARTFSRDAVVAIHERSGGVPRTINVICENALLTGFAADQRPIGDAIVYEVCGDFDLPPRAGPASTPDPAAAGPAPLQRTPEPARAGVANGSDERSTRRTATGQPRRRKPGQRR